MVQARLLIGTPPQDYDDSYTIKYAKLNNGYLVTNDMYRDHVKKITDKKEREDTKKWLKDHCISVSRVSSGWNFGGALWRGPGSYINQDIFIASTCRKTSAFMASTLAAMIVFRYRFLLTFPPSPYLLLLFSSIRLSKMSSFPIRTSTSGQPMAT